MSYIKSKVGEEEESNEDMRRVYNAGDNHSRFDIRNKDTNNIYGEP